MECLHQGKDLWHIPVFMFYVEVVIYLFEIYKILRCFSGQQSHDDFFYTKLFELCQNLDASVDNKTLYDEFSVYGSIISCTVATTAMGESKGYGFIQFEEEAVAKNVIDRSSNGNIIIHGRHVSVYPFVRKDGRGDLVNNDTLKFNNVYVKNFSEATTDEDLHRIFGEFGPITSAAVMRDSNGNSKCFGFVNFENVDDAANAVQMLNGKTINEKEWYVSRAQKKSEREAELKGKYEQVLRERVDSHRDANLYVKNIDESINETTLVDLFSQYGSVKSCKVCLVA